MSFASKITSQLTTLMCFKQEKTLAADLFIFIIKN